MDKITLLLILSFQVFHLAAHAEDANERINAEHFSFLYQENSKALRAMSKFMASHGGSRSEGACNFRGYSTKPLYTHEVPPDLANTVQWNIDSRSEQTSYSSFDASAGYHLDSCQLYLADGLDCTIGNDSQSLVYNPKVPWANIMPFGTVFTGYPVSCTSGGGRSLNLKIGENGMPLRRARKK